MISCQAKPIFVIKMFRSHESIHPASVHLTIEFWSSAAEAAACKLVGFSKTDPQSIRWLISIFLMGNPDALLNLERWSCERLGGSS